MLDHITANLPAMLSTLGSIYVIYRSYTEDQRTWKPVDWVTCTVIGALSLAVGVWYMLKD